MLNPTDSIHINSIRINGLEIYIKDILAFSYYDEQSGYIQFNKNEYTNYNIQEFYDVVNSKYNSSVCYIMGLDFKLNLSNGILHSLDTNAYDYYENKLYFIYGRLISRIDWEKHPSVVKNKRLKKLNKIFLMSENT